MITNDVNKATVFMYHHDANDAMIIYKKTFEDRYIYRPLRHIMHISGKGWKVEVQVLMENEFYHKGWLCADYAKNACVD